MKHRIFRLSPFLCLAGVLAAPARVLATQAHAAPEGIIGHQIAHVVFIVSMAILIYWLRERRLVEQPGWKYIQYAALFFILWNLDAFFAHLIDEQLLLVKVEKIDFWRRRIVAKNGFEGIESIYYLLKMDHLLCVPAMLFLYMGLRRLLRAMSPEGTQGGVK
ncbi:MAG: hypothetical protein PVG78_03885 [Desulfobacterales bacterium]|jgi:hypothetical protein